MKTKQFGYTLEVVKKPEAFGLFWFDDYWDDMICVGLPFIIILLYWDN